MPALPFASPLDLIYMHIKNHSIYAQYKENSGKLRYFVFKMTGKKNAPTVNHWTDQQLTIWQMNVHAAKTFNYETTKLFVLKVLLKE